MKIPIIKPNGEHKLLYIDGKLYELIQYFKSVVYEENSSVVIMNDGKSGYGKTTISFQEAILLDASFGLHKVYFTPHEFLNGLSEAKKGDCIIFDEALVLSSRSTLSEINKMVVTAMSMIRSKNLFVIFNVNSLFDLDKNLAIFRADCLCHVYAPSIKERGRFAMFFRAKDGHDRLKSLYLNGKRFYDYSKPKANFIGRFTKEFIVDEQEYEAKKKIGVDTFLRGADKPQLKAQRTRNRLINYLHYLEKWELSKIAKISGLQVPTLYEIVREQRQIYGKEGLIEDYGLSK